MQNNEFKSHEDWHCFNSYIKNKYRYILDPNQKRFTEVLLETTASREETIYKGEIFHRSRIGVDRTEFIPLTAFKYIPFPKSKMCNPPNEKATEGRINPKGISYLYLSKEEETAIAKVRPWLQERVTVAKWEVKEDIIIINTIPKVIFPYFPPNYKATLEEKEKSVWRDIDDAFSKPVQNNETSTEYIPTQYIAELFKNAGYDGIMYKSSLHEKGLNLALFNPNKVEFIDSYVKKITVLKYVFE